MTITQAQQKKRVTEFIKKWTGRGDEKQDTQEFWRGILQIFGIHELDFIKFEVPVMLENQSYIDGLIESTGVLIEQKSITVDLDKKERQSDGTILSPRRQAFRYTEGLSKSKQPRWIVVSNFKEIRIYDRECDIKQYTSIMLQDLKDNIECLRPLVDAQSAVIRKEMEVSKQAGEIVGKLYDELKDRYKNTLPDEAAKYLNKLCVRLVFCLYAEDTDIFGKHLMFHDYLAGSSLDALRQKLVDLFCVLNTEESKRNPYWDESLLAFPYVNGGLFEDAREDIEKQIPRLTERFKELLLDNASAGFNWSGISPTIFGAMFESTLNPDTRCSGGMHYTSIENIHKVIDPLFLGDLKAELQSIMDFKNPTKRRNELEKFRDRLASLTFLDPACGSGNFLTLTYTELRRLENTALQQIISDSKGVTEGQKLISSDSGLNAIKVSIQQFYGIEINDFAVSVAKTALWIAESQMMEETKQIVEDVPDFLPLSNLPNIREDNALRIDWNNVIDKSNLSYIISNPPFVGARKMDRSQKLDVTTIFKGVKSNGDLDYVSCWFQKASDMMTNSDIKTALVSTNSITQGLQMTVLWKHLCSQGIHIDYAYRTFQWDNRVEDKSGKHQKVDKYMAAVHVVIIAFSKCVNTEKRRLFTFNERDRSWSIEQVDHINGYLMSGEDVFIRSRGTSICKSPKMQMGNQPIDNGNYLFTYDEMIEFIKREPKSEKYFRKWYGAEEYIRCRPRYCLYLRTCTATELTHMPMCQIRVDAVRDYRAESTRQSTKKLATEPKKFQTEVVPQEAYLVFPETSSQNRVYVPIGFMDTDSICSNRLKIIQGATIYDFGILTSRVHMVWMKYVCGRLKSDFSYSIEIVYNNFPWCSPSKSQKPAIEQTAKAILDARSKHEELTLYDMYDRDSMPDDLRAAHKANDRAVMRAYGFSMSMTDEQIMSKLIDLYKSLTAKETGN